jgi:hypothetical protein
LIGQQELDLLERLAVPPADADEEGERPGGGREAGRLRVEADQGSVARRLARQGREPFAIERDRDGRAFDPDVGSCGGTDYLAIDGLGQALGLIRRQAARRRIVTGR